MVSTVRKSAVAARLSMRTSVIAALEYNLLIS